VVVSISPSAGLSTTSFCQIALLRGRPRRVAWRIDHFCSSTSLDSSASTEEPSGVSRSRSLAQSKCQSAVSMLRLSFQAAVMLPQQIRFDSNNVPHRKTLLIGSVHIVTFELITSPDRNHHASNPHAPSSRRLQLQPEQQRPRLLRDCSHAAPYPRSPSSTAW
jgi:hypothetical protein